MPEISRFLGISVCMYYREHPPPHFHAKYGEFEITVEIQSGVVEGRFPGRALGSLLEWHGLHQDELMDNWTLAEKKESLKKIPPLE